MAKKRTKAQQKNAAERLEQTEKINNIKNIFEVEFKIKGDTANSLAREFVNIEKSSSRANAEVFLLEKRAEALNKTLGSLQGIASRVSAAVGTATGFFNLANLSLKNGFDLSQKYNDSIVKGAAQFSKYGMTLNSFKGSVDQLRGSFNLTYDQAIQFTTQMERTFKVNGPEKFNSYMRLLKDTVGGNVDAMRAFGAELEAIASIDTNFEDLIASGDKQGAYDYAKSMYFSGSINRNQFKAAQELAFANSRSPQEAANLNKQQESNEMFRRMNKGLETGLKNAGDITTDLVTKTVNLTGGVEAWGSAVEKVAGSYILIQSAVSGIAGMTGGAGGMLKSGLDLLDGLANVNNLSGGKLGRRLGKGAIGGLGRLATGAGGAFVGSAGAMAATAAVGLYGGNYIGNSIWGVNGALDSSDSLMNDSKSRSEDSSLSRRNQLRFKNSELSSRKAKETLESQSGIWGNIKSIFGYEGEASQETLQEIEKVKQEMSNITEEVEKTKKASTSTLSIDQQMIVNRERLLNSSRIYNESLSKSNSLLSIQLDIYNKSGNVLARNASINQNSIALQNSRNPQKELLDMQEKSLNKTRMENEEKRKAGLLTTSDLEKEQNEAAKVTEFRTKLFEIDTKIASNINETTKAYEFSIEMQRSNVSLLESTVSLYDNAGFGLRAQLSTRKQLSDAVKEEMNLEQEKLKATSEARKQIESQLLNSKDETEIAGFQAALRQNTKDTTDGLQRLTSLTAKLAEISKASREGWIQAIGQMNQGAGVFSRITISQNRGLGNLAFARPDDINTLTLGGTTGGRRNSANWTPGGFNEGTAGDREKRILGDLGIDPYNMTQKNAEKLMKKQIEAAEKMSKEAASLGKGPQGMGEVTSTNPPGGIQKGIGSGKAAVVTENDLDDIKRSFIDAFSKIGSEIVTETIKRIRDK